jgi:hypothetical protein
MQSRPVQAGLANRPSLQALVQELLTAVMSYIVYGSP